MAKLGVGVGEEFPLDDGKADQGAQAHCQGHHEGHDHSFHRWFGDHPHFGPPQLIKILAALALAGLVIFALTHIVYVALGAVVLGVLYFGHRHGFDFSPTGKPPAQSP
jgi:hypothetical protein